MNVNSIARFTPAQMAMLMHRLELTDCIAQVLASSENHETPDDKFDECVAAAQARLEPKAIALLDYVSTHRKLPAEMDDDAKQIILEAIEGNTWFANEGWDERTPLWWASQRRVAQVVERIIGDAAGRAVRFPNN